LISFRNTSQGKPKALRLSLKICITNYNKITRAIGIFLLIIAVLMGIMYSVINYAITNDVKNIIGYVVGAFGFAVIVGVIILIIYLQRYNKNKK
jgi:nitrate reductase gamma subunit